MEKMKDSGIEWIGNIPKEWEIKKIKYITKIPITDGPHETPVFVDEGVPFYSVDGIQNEKIVYEPCRYISVEDANRFDKKIIPSYGDILMGKAASIGKIAVIDKHIRMQVWSPLAIIRVNENIMNNVFLKYYLLSNSAQIEIDLKSTSNTQKNIAMEDIENITIPFFNIKEQKLIADFLDNKIEKIDDILNNLNKQVEILEKYKKSLITETVTKGLNLNVEMKDSGIKWIKQIPNDWNVIKLKYASWLKGRIGWQGLRADEFIDDEKCPYLITGTDFDTGYINWNTCVHIKKERYLQDYAIHIREDDLLITKDGTIGKVAVAKNCPKEVSLNSGVFIIRNTGKYKYDDRYMYYLLQSNQFTEWYDLSNAGNSTIKHLNQEKFYEFQFTNPPMEEQNKIAKFLDAKCTQVDEIIKDKQNQIDKMEKYKKSLIYEYVTGKKRVKGAEELYV